MNKVFGLIGKNISYSFSKKYFTDKFEKEEMLGYSYENFETVRSQLQKGGIRLAKVLNDLFL